MVDDGMRWRDLETGTYLTRDPIGYFDGPNVYCYVHCNPITKFDALGLFADKDEREAFDEAYAKFKESDAAKTEHGQNIIAVIDELYGSGALEGAEDAQGNNIEAKIYFDETYNEGVGTYDVEDGKGSITFSASYLKNGKGLSGMIGHEGTHGVQHKQQGDKYEKNKNHEYEAYAVQELVNHQVHGWELTSKSAIKSKVDGDLRYKYLPERQNWVGSDGIDEIYTKCEDEKYSHLNKKSRSLTERLQKNESGSSGKKREYWKKHQPEYDKIWEGGGSWKGDVEYYFR